MPTAELPRIPPGTRVLDPDDAGDHLDRLHRAARALTGSRERADDLVQDTYVRVLSRPRFLRNDNDLGYLLRVMRNTFISQQRRANGRPRIATAYELDWIEDRRAPQPQKVAETHLLYETIAELPHNFRDALVAVDVAGLPYREAARALRVPEATLTTRLFRARKRVAAALGNDASAEGSSSPRLASCACRSLGATA